MFHVKHRKVSMAANSNYVIEERKKRRFIFFGKKQTVYQVVILHNLEDKLVVFESLDYAEAFLFKAKCEMAEKSIQRPPEYI